MSLLNKKQMMGLGVIFLFSQLMLVLAESAGGKSDTPKNTSGSHNDTGGHSGGHSGGSLDVVSINFHEIRDPLIFTIVVLLAGISKVGYHHANFLSSKVPESCILLILGTVLGSIIHFSGISGDLPQFFEPHEFFIFLLPPIILEAAYSLHDRTFMENIGSILLFAVVGTILASALLGGTLYGLAQAGAMGEITDLSFVEIMVFSSLIVAVDPVAVLAVFNEIGVNHVLYFLVFGESLLNDGVTVVLYKVFQAYNLMDEITSVHIILGIVKFFVVCLGGLLSGVLAGIGTAVLTKYATHVKVAQPIIMYTMAYMGFLVAELFGFSGIISIIGCGLTQVQYAFHNISDKSRTTLKYFTKVISSASEIIIFLFLGLSMVNDSHDWHTGFTLWTIFFCLFFRFIIIFSISYLVNWLDIYRVRKIGLQEQFMIAYGGLRGAVAFSLVALLDPKDLPAKNMFVTTTLAVIVFTVFIQGISIKPLVHMLQISLAPEKCRTMFNEFNTHVTDHMMAGVENIIGEHGRHHLREKIENLDVKYLKPLLQVAPDPRDTDLKNFYENLLLKEHYNYLKLSGAKTLGEAPEMDDYPEVLQHLGPRVNTEMLLSTLSKSQKPAEQTMSLVKEAITRMRPSKTDEGKERNIPEITIEDQPESDVELRGRRRFPRKSLFSRGKSYETGDIDASALRQLLSSTRNSRMSYSHYDRNLTAGEDMHSGITHKTSQNRRLQRLFSEKGRGSTRRKSWSENQGEANEARSKENKTYHRHAATIDLGNAGRLGAFNPIGDDSISPISPGLDQVFEEDEVAGGERDPMINGKEEGKGNKDLELHKHKLERQLGLDRAASGQTTPPVGGLAKAAELGRHTVPEIDKAAKKGHGDHKNTLHHQEAMDSQSIPMLDLGKSDTEQDDKEKKGDEKKKDDKDRGSRL